MRTEDELTMFVVYKWPKDFPGKFVVRRHFIQMGEETPPGVQYAADCTTHDTLEEARESLLPGLVRLDPMPNDNPVVVEVWL